MEGGNERVVREIWVICSKFVAKLEYPQNTQKSSPEPVGRLS